MARKRAVVSSPREQAKHAVIDPFVDFSSLDLVGVVVGSAGRDSRGVLADQAGPRIPDQLPGYAPYRAPADVPDGAQSR